MGFKRYAFVGTWQDFGGHGEGIHVFLVDPQNGSLTETDHLTGFRNNSILCVSRNGRRVYATIEDKNYKDVWGAGGGVLAMEFDPATGKIAAQNDVSAMGACTSYICMDPGEQFILVTNHGSGLDVVTKAVSNGHGGYELQKEYDDSTLVMFRLKEDKSLGNVCDLHKHQGRGALRVRGQVCSHLHSVNFDPSGQWVLACDKGCDCIYIYRFNRERGILESTPHTVFHCWPGSAPRHLEFHPWAPYCYVNHETLSTVSAYRFCSQAGTLEEIDYKSMVDIALGTDPNTIGDTYGSPADIHVHPSGRFLYSSQRSSYTTGQGQDLISVFSIDAGTGRLGRVSNVALEGPCPRGFAIDPDGRFLYVGNQYLDTITRFIIDPETGDLKDPRTVARVATPTCIRMIDIAKL